MFALLVLLMMLGQLPPTQSLLIDARAQAPGRVHEPTRASAGSKGAILHVNVSLVVSQPIPREGTFDFEFVIVNTGTQPLQLPKVIGVRKFEPSDMQSRSYTVQHFRLVASSVGSPTCRVSGTADLYGIPNDENSMTTLLPNKHLRILARGVSSCPAREQVQEANVIATADLARETAYREAGELTEHVDDIGFAQSKVISIRVH